MSMAAGVVVEKESEYISALTELRAFDGRPHGCVWVGVTPVSSYLRHT